MFLKMSLFLLSIKSVIRLLVLVTTIDGGALWCVRNFEKSTAIARALTRR